MLAIYYSSSTPKNYRFIYTCLHFETAHVIVYVRVRNVLKARITTDKIKIYSKSFIIYYRARNICKGCYVRRLDCSLIDRFSIVIRYIIIAKVSCIFIITFFVGYIRSSSRRIKKCKGGFSISLLNLLDFICVVLYQCAVCTQRDVYFFKTQCAHCGRINDRLDSVNISFGARNTGSNYVL